MLSVATRTPDGLQWTDTVGETEADATLYYGGSGIVLALLEGHRHFADDRYADAALLGARDVAARVAQPDHASMYFGLAGMAFALWSVGEALRDNALVAAAGRATDRLRSEFDGDAWGEMYELLAGNAGIALCALAIGDVELAQLAVDRYPRAAEPTPHGVTWQHRKDIAARLHHISHGTLGIAFSLAAVGRATGRTELIDLALAGAADVLSRDEAGPDGFLVPHSDPQYRPGIIERYSYGWCHGPAGDAQVFRLLHDVTKDPAWRSLGDRCWHSVTHSGLPQRLRPGFWDNSGRCCGTAGVLALACDRQVEQGGGLDGELDTGLDFADVLVADIGERATVDATGVRWSNHEHRVTPSALPPRRGWGHGNAGIIRELLRYARIGDGGDPAYAIGWPDQLAITPPAGVPPPRRARAGNGILPDTPTDTDPVR